MTEKQTSRIILGIFIVAKFIIQYTVVDTGYELHRDEYLHLDQADHLAWGFLSVPPFTSWISVIVKALGNSVFWVRFFPALFGAITIGIVWRTVEKLNGSLFACILAASGLLFSVLLRLNILYQPNSADVLFWTLSYYFLIRYIGTNQNKYLYFMAVAFAFGMLNKYNIIFWAAGILPAMLITSQRRILANKHFWYAAILAFIIFLPNLLWQFSNDFPVIHHMQELKKRQLVNVKLDDFLKDQLFYFVGSFFIWVAAFPAFVFFPAFRKYRMIGWSFLFIMIIFISLKAKSYYTIGLYPIFFAFGSVYLESITERKVLRAWRYILPVIPLLVLIPMFNIIFPLLSPKEIIAKREKFERFGLLRWEDGKNHDLPQDFADMRGWKEMSRLADSAYAMIPENERKNTIIYCDNYGQAGALNYYSRFKNFGAVSFNADYLTWFPWSTDIKHLIRVKEMDADDDDPDDLQEKELFKNYYLIGKISDSSAREFNTKVLLLMNARADITEVLKEDMKD